MSRHYTFGSTKPFSSLFDLTVAMSKKEKKRKEGEIIDAVRVVSPEVQTVARVKKKGFDVKVDAKKKKRISDQRN